MKVLNYKGLRFDDFAQNEDGTYWAEMCQDCTKKYCDLVQSEIDDGGTARGVCSVIGCCNDGEDAYPHYYIDFDPGFVSFEEVTEADVYDEQYL